MNESPYPMLPVDEALAIVLAQASALPSEDVSLSQALGRVLFQDAVAGESLPPFPASVKDGYAVVAADGPGDYPVIGQATAGHVSDFAISPGAIAYITTGAPLPDGADAVVMVEATESLDAANGWPRVRIHAQVEPGDDVRPVGVDIAVGDMVLAAGDCIGPAEVGLLATVGITAVTVYRRPRVAILSTGDELVEPGEFVAPGQIRDSNRYTLAAAVSAAGGIAVDLGIGPDNRVDLEAAIRRGLAEADILLTSGGVSMGDLDLIKPILAEAGVIHFGRMRMKPGKPLTFATVSVDQAPNSGASIDQAQKLVFGLPGNPVSSLVTFYLVVVPAMRKLAGWADPNLRRVQATLAQSLVLDPGRPEYHRAVLQWDETLNGGLGGFLARSTGSQASSRLLSMRTANALLELPQAGGKLDAGAPVSALLIGEL